MVTAEKVNPLNKLLERLQLPDERAPLSLEVISMGVAGVLIPLGLARLFSSLPLGLLAPVETSGALPLFFAALFLFAFAAAVFLVPQIAGLRPAGYAIVLSAAAILAEAASRLGNDPKGMLGVVLFILLCTGLLVLPKTRHIVFLGAVLFSVWRFFVLLTGTFEVPTRFSTAMDPSRLSDLTNLSAGVSLLLAAGCLAAVWYLDRNHAFGLSLPFAAVGIVIAASAVLTRPNLFVVFLALNVAVAAIWVGYEGERRGVAWAGAAGVVLALSRLYDGVNNRFGGLVVLLVGLGVLAFAARNELPVLVKSLGTLTSNSAVLPASAYPEQGQLQRRQGFSQPDSEGPVSGAGPGANSSFSRAGNQPEVLSFPNGGEQSSPANSPDSNNTGNPHYDSEAFQPSDVQPGSNQRAEDFQSTDFETGADDLGLNDYRSPDAEQLSNGQSSSEYERSDGSGEPATTEFQLSDYQAESFSRSAGGSASAVRLEDGTVPFEPQLDQAVTGQAVTDQTAADRPLAEPNWYADPTERYDHRWHDGVNWTEHVATAGNSAVDPIS